MDHQMDADISSRQYPVGETLDEYDWHWLCGGRFDTFTAIAVLLTIALIMMNMPESSANN